MTSPATVPHNDSLDDHPAADLRTQGKKRKKKFLDFTGEIFKERNT